VQAIELPPVSEQVWLGAQSVAAHAQVTVALHPLGRAAQL